MTEERRYSFSPRLVLGIVAIILGILLTLENLGLLGLEDPWRLWPLALIGIGLSKIVQSRRGEGRGWGIVLLAIGVWLLLQNLNVIRYDFWDFWPLLLVIIGANILWQAFSSKPAGKSSPQSDAMVKGFALLSGVKTRSASQDFRGGDLTAVMGGCEVDLTKAKISGDEAVIDTFAWWGGIEIKVPESWTVVVRGLPLLGGFEDKTKGPADGGQTLIVKGLAIMGAVEIDN